MGQGYAEKFYYDATALSSADASTATWTELDLVRDQTTNDSRSENDATTRANDGRQAYEVGLRDQGLEFEVKYVPTDAGYLAIETAYNAGNTIAMAAMDGDITVDGAKGVAGNFVITNFTKNAPLNGTVTVNVTARPHSYGSDFEVEVV